MKKLFLLLTMAGLGFSASAQYVNPSSIMLQSKGSPLKYENHDVGTRPSTAFNQNGKPTAVGGNRWYSHFDYVDTYLEDLAARDYVFNIWFDSTVQERFNTGLNRINFSSLYQVIDPIGTGIFNDPSFAGDPDMADEIKVGRWDDYKVDSIYIRGAYVRMPGRPTNVVDTAIISIVPLNRTQTRSLTAATYPKISQYTTDAQITSISPMSVDSVNRAAFSTVAGSPGVMWKELLVDSLGDPPGAGGNTFTTRTWLFAVPSGGINIPKGSPFAITFTFKSGEMSTITPNVDTVGKYHRFMPIAAERGDGTAMPYYYPETFDKDLSMSGLMFSWDSAGYDPSLFIETWNTNDFSREFFDIGGHVTCATCFALDVNNVNSNIVSKVSAFPNPANNEVRVKFELQRAADATITFTNAVGQVVRTENVANAQKSDVVINTSDLSNGFYFYTVEAEGQKMTGKVLINH